MKTQKLTQLYIEVQTPDNEPYCESSPNDPYKSLCGEWELMGPDIPMAECTDLCSKCQRIRS